jgi:serine/threonine-protein kinase
MRQFRSPAEYPTGFTDVIPIGRGSQGWVFRATKSSIGKVVALKAFPLGPAEGIHERALRAEVRALVALSRHPGVVDVHDLHVGDGWAWLEMDYCGGGSSGTWVAHRGNHGDGELCAAVSALLLLGRQVAAALHFAHQQGWVHGDVKPSNILLDDLGAARLCDFGLARLAAVGVIVGTGFRAPGTPRFQPPEVAAGAAPTAAGDVFALAETLRDLRRLLVSDDVVTTARVRDPDVTDTGELGMSCCEVLADLEVLLAHMSDADPGLRPRADEVAERLATLGARVEASGEGPSISSSSSSSSSSSAEVAAARSGAGTQPAGLPAAGPERPGAEGRAGRLRIIAAAVASLLVLLVGVFFQLRRADSEGGTGPTTVPARMPATRTSARTPPSEGRDPTRSPSPVTSPTPSRSVPFSGEPAPPTARTTGGGEPAKPGPPAGTETGPVPSPSARDGPTTLTYHFPAGVLSPQLIEGNCVYRVFYGNIGATPFAKVRFYSGDCGGVDLTVTARREGATSYYGYTNGSTGTDSCGAYIESQADSGGVAATAVGETLHFPATGRGYAFVSGAGPPVSPYRNC